MKKLPFFRKASPAPLKVEQAMPSLATCLLMDVIGYATYAVPFFGEFLDLLWAPVSAVIFWKLFGFRKGLLGGMFSFVEELMPGLDFIPTFTINWAILYFRKAKNPLAVRPLVR